MERLEEHFEDWTRTLPNPVFSPPPAPPSDESIAWQLGVGMQLCPVLGEDEAIFVWCKATGGAFKWSHAGSTTEIAALTGLTPNSVVAYAESDRALKNAKLLQTLVKCGAADAGVKSGELWHSHFLFRQTRRFARVDAAAGAGYWRWDKDTATRHLEKGVANDLHAKVEIFRISMSSALCLLAMSDGAAADADHKRGNVSAEQLQNFSFPVISPDAASDPDLRWRELLDFVQLPVTNAHIYTMSATTNYAGRDKVIDKFINDDAHAKIIMASALWRMQQLKSQHQTELAARTSADEDEARDSKKRTQEDARKIKELEEEKLLFAQTKAAESGTSAVLDKLAALLKPPSSPEALSLWEEFSALDSDSARKSWMKAYRPPKTNATISQRDLEDALTRGRGVPPSEGGCPPLRWRNAPQFFASRDEQRDLSRALRNFICPEGHARMERVRTAAPLVVLENSTWAYHNRSNASDSIACHVPLLKRECQECVVLLMTADVHDEVSMVGAPPKTSLGAMSLQCFCSSIDELLCSRFSPGIDPFAGSLGPIRVRSLAHAIKLAQDPREISLETYIFNTTANPVFKQDAIQVASEMRWELLVTVLKTLGLVTGDGIATLSSQLREHPLAATLSSRHITRLFLPAVLWAAGRNCKTSLSKYGAGPPGSWENGAWLCTNITLLQSMLAGMEVPSDVVHALACENKDNPGKLAAPVPSRPDVQPIVPVGDTAGPMAPNKSSLLRSNADPTGNFGGNSKLGLPPLMAHSFGKNMGADMASVGQQFLYEDPEGMLQIRGPGTSSDQGEPAIPKGFSLPPAVIHKNLLEVDLVLACKQDGVRAWPQAHRFGDRPSTANGQPAPDSEVVAFGGGRRPAKFPGGSDLDMTGVALLYAERTRAGEFRLKGAPGVKVGLMFELATGACKQYFTTGACSIPQHAHGDCGDHILLSDAWTTIGYLPYKQYLAHAEVGMNRINNANLRVFDKKRPRPKDAVAMAPPKRRYEDLQHQKPESQGWSLTSDNGPSKNAAPNRGNKIPWINKAAGGNPRKPGGGGAKGGKGGKKR